MQRKILLIDDDIEDYLIIKDAFEDIGSPVLLEYAGGGEKGWQILDQAHAKGERLPELIVLDINMPVIDGPAFLRLIRADERFKNLQVVIYSTAIHPNDQLKCTEMGVIKCITKPTSLDEIVAVGTAFLAMCETETTNR